MNCPRSVIGLALVALSCTTLLAADKEETFPNGKTKAKYAVDDEGRKHGDYLEYFEDGKVKVKARYNAGALDGPYASFHDNGKSYIAATYKNGKLQGDYKESADDGKLVLKAGYRDDQLSGWRSAYDKGRIATSAFYRDGECLIPRGPEEIKKTLDAILRAPAAKGADSERQAGLRQLKAYRYLCGVPYENLELDDDLNKSAQAAARLCDKIGRLDHQPANPGLPKEEYDLAFKGASNSNLAFGARSLAEAVDIWIDDSDPKNIERLGHRRGCLNPALQQTGLGKSGKYAALWVHGASPDNLPDYDFISFPPRGLMPVRYFKPKYAWNISLNPKKYGAPDDAIKVKVYYLDKTYNKTGKPLDLAYMKVDRNLRGSTPHSIIFLPKDLSLSRVWVEVEGLMDSEGKPATVHFLTEFVTLN
jgi:Cysteine-rich secretory protein family